MIELRAFAESLYDAKNEPGTVATIGELTPISTTYSGEIGRYPVDGNNTLVAAVFSTKDQVGNKVSPDALLLEAVDLIILKTFTAAATGSVSESSAAFASRLLTYLDETISIEECGAMVVRGSQAVPSSIRFLLYPQTNRTQAIARGRIWFSGAAFENEYDDYEIDVVPFGVPLDTLLTGAGVAGYIGSTEAKLVNVMPRISETAGNVPYTAVRTTEIEFHRELDGAVSGSIPWTTIHRGPTGLNIDAIQQAIFKYIERTSSVGLTVWGARFPDIFFDTEFVVVPCWRFVAIPNLSSDTGVYSPDLSFAEVAAAAQAGAKGVGYTANHIAENARMLPTTHRGLLAVYVPGPNNPTGKNSIRNIYPDFGAVPTGSVLFAMLSETTREFATKLGQLIECADQVTATSAVPTDICARVERDGLYYVAAVVDKVNILVLTRYSSIGLTDTSSFGL